MHTSFSFEIERIQENEHAQSTVEVADVTSDWPRCRLKNLLTMLAICGIRFVLRDEDKDICSAYEGRHTQ